TSQPDLVERMIGEARTVARLRSEHVAHVIDVGRLASGAPFIVMEYLDGCDLATKLAYAEPLPIELTVAYVLQACEAVAEAHAAGIIHRDIKPENLFLSARTDGEPTVKVLDFGISRSMKSGDRDAADSLIAGSPDYMSPESMRADARVAPSADIWSLGAVLYEMMTGRRPFEAATVSETCTRVLSSDPVVPSALVPSIPSGLEAVVLRCLRKEPAHRFASVVELAAALAAFGPDGSAEQAERVARVASGGRWNPRSTATPKRLSFPSFSDVPNSTSAVVAEPQRPTAPTAIVSPRRRRWQTAAIAIGAAAAIFAIAVRPRSSPPPARAQVAAVAAPPTEVASAPASEPLRPAATSVAIASATATVQPKRSGNALAAKRNALPSATALSSEGFSYDDETPSMAPSASSDTAPSASAGAPGEPSASEPSPKVAESAPVDAWSPDSFGGRK
ncbi:MAG: protein kinase, partial [Myxococcales bacterium]|nr:protein kinase [Myxococcales bacterium]